MRSAQRDRSFPPSGPPSRTPGRRAEPEGEHTPRRAEAPSGSAFPRGTRAAEDGTPRELLPYAASHNTAADRSSCVRLRRRIPPFAHTPFHRCDNRIPHSAAQDGSRRQNESEKARTTSKTKHSSASDFPLKFEVLPDMVSIPLPVSFCKRRKKKNKKIRDGCILISAGVDYKKTEEPA